MSTLAPTATFAPPTYITPLSIQLDRVTYAYGLAFRTHRRGNTAEARQLVIDATRHLELVEQAIARLVDGDPVNDKARLLEHVSFCRSFQGGFLDF